MQNNKSKAKPSYLGYFKGFIVLMVVTYVLMMSFLLSRPMYDYWYCVFNPLTCVAQGTTITLVDNVLAFVNPYTIGIMVVIYAVVRRKNKK